jgi:hypothetical protein
MTVRVAACLVTLALAAATGLSARQDPPPPPATDPLHAPFDQMLDIYVRDGLVYYNALKIERARFDRYVASLDGPEVSAQYAKWSQPKQLAFWLNAYNAFVLRSVIDAYPIRGKAPQYPASSIRQIPGAFERRTFRAAGRALTLDALEKDVLTTFGDPRAFLALGRGANGGGRLRSEAYASERLDRQLAEAAAEVADRRDLARVDTVAGELTISPIFSWREASFTAAYADKALPVFSSRSPMERAVLALMQPHLVTSEVEFLEKNAFRVRFHDFDWSLNDLTGR